MEQALQDLLQSIETSVTDIVGELAALRDVVEKILKRMPEK